MCIHNRCSGHLWLCVWPASAWDLGLQAQNNSSHVERELVHVNFGLVERTYTMHIFPATKFIQQIPRGEFLTVLMLAAGVEACAKQKRTQMSPPFFLVFPFPACSSLPHKLKFSSEPAAVHPHEDMQRHPEMVLVAAAGGWGSTCRMVGGGREAAPPSACSAQDAPTRRPIRPQGRQCGGRETPLYTDVPSCQASLTNRLEQYTAFSISPFLKPPLFSLKVEITLSPLHSVSTLHSFTVTSLQPSASWLCFLALLWL